MATNPAPRFPDYVLTLAESLGLIVTYSHSSYGASLWSISRADTDEAVSGPLTIFEAIALLCGF